MAFIQLNFFSNALGMQTQVDVILPQKNTVGEIGVDNRSQEGSYKCLYLLHGLSDDQTIWHRRTSIERYSAEYGLCVVMPCAGRSFYMNEKSGNAYYTYIAKELPARISEFFNVSNKREDRGVAGLSMGGYGALKIGLKENAVFGMAAGLSSVADIRSERFAQHLKNLLGEENYISDDEDLFALAVQKNNESVKPRVYMACGTEDFLYDDNVRLKECFEKLDYDYTYEEGPGVHCWEYWDKQIQNVLKWMFGSK